MIGVQETTMSGATAPAWPLYNATTDSYLDITPAPTAAAGVRTAACDLWDAIRAAGTTQ